MSEVAAWNDVTLPEDFKARHFSPEEDIVQFDLVVVMDKFTAADVLREVCWPVVLACLFLSVICYHTCKLRLDQVVTADCDGWGCFGSSLYMLVLIIASLPA